MWRTLAACVTLAAFALAGSYASAQSLEAVKLKRKKITHLEQSKLEIEYSVLVENSSGTDYPFLDIVVAPTHDGIRILDGTATVEGLASYSSGWSTDTIIIIADMRAGSIFPDDFNIAFDDQSLNGIDADSDGIRDDVQLKIEARRGPEFLEDSNARAYLTTVQSRTVSPLSDQELVISYLNSAQALLCLEAGGVDISHLTMEVGLVQFNTEERRQAFKQNEYRMALAGSALDLGFGDLKDPATACSASP